MCPCAKFQLIWRTSDFGIKFAPKNMKDKNFEKINIKFEIMCACTKFQSIWRILVLGTKFVKKHFRVYMEMEPENNLF